MEEMIRFEAQFTEVIPIGVVPDGVRIDFHFAGTITAGPLRGGTVRGIDYVLLRSDGVSVLDVREVVTTPSGEHIAIRAQGYGAAGNGRQSMSPEVMLAPDFTWPDEDTPIHGVAFCQTSIAELA